MIKTLFFRLFNIVEYEFEPQERKVFEYFKEIALKAEFGYRPRRVIKWTKPMKVFIKKEKVYNTQVVIIKETIEQLNELATDGFKVELIDNIFKCNIVLYLNKKTKVNEIDPYFFKGINEDFIGLVDIEFDSHDFNIIKGRIFIDTEQPIDIQKSTIIEELTQSIGLMNDSELYQESTFFQNKSSSRKKHLKHSGIDVELIKLLYLPSMKPGFDEEQVEKVIKRYYKSLKT
ncbi:hypothetical protein BFR04_05380 [Gaetbulibacter sp. 4G1]|nr:DUF2927 domain-containing protein [Gaetbulibacter sp. 4G1]PIA78954.1 hypothetical protein BFR04_05380 [Gaetbulibacter sp. 4G1]